MEVVKSNEHKHATSKEVQQKSIKHNFQFHYRFMGYVSVQELASAAFSYLYHNIKKTRAIMGEVMSIGHKPATSKNTLYA